MGSSSVNDVFCKWLPDKFNTFNWSNENSISVGIGPMSATDSAVKLWRFWNWKKRETFLTIKQRLMGNYKKNQNNIKIAFETN